MPAVTQPIIVKSGSGNNQLLELGLLLGGGALVYFKWVGPYLKKVADKKQLAKDEAATIKPAPGKRLFDLVGRPIKSANLATIAADLKDSLKFPTDDPRVVRVFQTTPFGYVKKLQEFYLDKYGKDLQQELVSNLNDKSWIAIKYNFR
jgi:hypothetical protein